jgi:hypothetical protein
MGWFSKFFDEKIEVEVNGEKRWVSKQKFEEIINKAKAEGKAKRICDVHILSLSGTCRVEQRVWQPDYQAWLDDNSGALYAIEAYENGEPTMSLLKKELWQRIAAQWQHEASQIAMNIEQSINEMKAMTSKK